MRRKFAALGGLVLSAVVSTEALAVRWNVYIPPAPYSASPPPYSASTWVLAKTFDSDDPTADPLEFDPNNGDIDCRGVSLNIRDQYFSTVNLDAASRALQAVCVSQDTGNIIPAEKK
jgi:hypothetical protein